MQDESKLSQVDSKSVQNEPTLIDYSSLPETPLNSFSDITEFPLSLFSEPEQTPPHVPVWVSLSEIQQRPWRDQAQRELVALHAGSGITPKPKLIQVRARNLYDIAQKKNNG